MLRKEDVVKTSLYQRACRLLMVICLLPVILLATERCSVDLSGVQGDDDSKQPSISADGRYTAFASFSSNLVKGFNVYNNANDIYLHDSIDNFNMLISAAALPWEQADGNSSDPVISADGRYVVFATGATNLDPENNCRDGNIFLYGLGSELECVSISTNGREGNKKSDQPDISADGSYIVFRSAADNLVPGDTNNHTDIFIHKLVGQQTVRVSLGQSGYEYNSDSYQPSISADGLYVVFVNDGYDNNPRIIFRDWKNGKTELISVNSADISGNGWSNNPSISGNASFVVFDSSSTNLVADDTNNAVDVFIRDRETNTTERISVNSLSVQGNDNSFHGSVSADGRYVVFTSYADNLVADDTNGKTDIFVRDRFRGLTKRISVNSAGEQGNDFSGTPSISDDGKHVVFTSYATNLVPGDTNGKYDVFVNEISSTNLSAVIMYLLN